MHFNYLKLTLIVLLISTFMNACGASVIIPTSTAVPTNTSIQPTNTIVPTSTPIPSTSTPNADSCEPGKNIFTPLNVTYIGEIDGVILTREVEKLSGSEVDLTGKVIEAQYFYIPGTVNATLVLVEIPGDDGKFYKVLIELPDGGIAVDQYLAGTDIHVVGVVLGSVPAPTGLFHVSPNVDGELFPVIFAEIASGGCK